MELPNLQNLIPILVMLFFIVLMLRVVRKRPANKTLIQKKIKIETKDNKGLVYVNFWPRILSLIVDAFLMMPLVIVSRKIDFYTVKTGSLWPQIVWQVFLLGIYFLFLTRRGGTPGELILKFRVINTKGKFLKTLPAILRLSPLIFASAIFILQWHSFLQSETFSTLSSMKNLGQLRMDEGGIYTTLYLAMSFFWLADYITIAFNSKKRAIHDFLGSCFVVTKESYLTLKSQSTGNSNPSELGTQS